MPNTVRIRAWEAFQRPHALPTLLYQRLTVRMHLEATGSPVVVPKPAHIPLSTITTHERVNAQQRTVLASRSITTTSTPLSRNFCFPRATRQRRRKPCSANPSATDPSGPRRSRLSPLLPASISAVAYPPTSSLSSFPNIHIQADLQSHKYSLPPVTLIVSETLEATLPPHYDISIPLSVPIPHADAYAQALNTAPRTLHILLLTPSSLPALLTPPSTPSTTPIHRLATLTGGLDVVIVYLLSPSTPPTTTTDPAEPTRAYMHLQAHLASCASLAGIAVLPLHAPAGLAALLTRYRDGLVAAPRPTSHSLPSSSGKALELLQWCTTGAPRRLMGQGAVLRVTEVAGCLRALAGVLGGVEGRALVRETLGGVVEAGEVEGIVEFWGEEWVVE